MNKLPAPLDTFEIDVPKNQYYDFELAPGSTYPLAGVTYPVDYGHIEGYTTEDGHELDLFVGSQTDGELGYVVVDRGANTPDEHKFFLQLSISDLQEVLSQLKPVLIKQERFEKIDDLRKMIEEYKDKK
jgi:hypothetical protein